MRNEKREDLESDVTRAEPSAEQSARAECRHRRVESSRGWWVGQDDSLRTG